MSRFAATLLGLSLLLGSASLAQAGPIILRSNQALIYVVEYRSPTLGAWQVYGEYSDTYTAGSVSAWLTDQNIASRIVERVVIIGYVCRPRLYLNYDPHCDYLFWHLHSDHHHHHHHHDLDFDHKKHDGDHDKKKVQTFNQNQNQHGLGISKEHIKKFDIDPRFSQDKKKPQVQIFSNNSNSREIKKFEVKKFDTNPTFQNFNSSGNGNSQFKVKLQSNQSTRNLSLNGSGSGNGNGNHNNNRRSHR